MEQNLLGGLYVQPGVFSGEKRSMMKNRVFFAMSLSICCAACLILSACGREGTLEESAVPVVNSIIQRYVTGGAKCIKVKITEKVDSKHFKANATLDNGNDLKIMIEDRGDQIYVTIPNDQE